MSTLVLSRRRRWTGGPVIAAVSGSALVALGVVSVQGEWASFGRPPNLAGRRRHRRRRAQHRAAVRRPAQPGTGRAGAVRAAHRLGRRHARRRRPPRSGSPSAADCRSRSGWPLAGRRRARDPGALAAHSGPVDGAVDGRHRRLVRGPGRLGRAEPGPARAGGLAARTGPGGPRRTRRTAIAEARRAERTKIAREMHDVLAHRLSLLAAYAGALEFRPDAPPEELARAAGVIRDGAHQALEELREVIGVLRDDPAEKEPDRPQPTLSDLPRLLDEARAAGTAGHGWTTAWPTPATVPDVLGRTVYRVVQEALTNARKHAPGQEATVLLGGRRGRQPARRGHQPDSAPCAAATPAGSRAAAAGWSACASGCSWPAAGSTRGPATAGSGSGRCCRGRREGAHRRRRRAGPRARCG